MDSARLAAIAALHGVELVVQFRSTFVGRAHAGSDVDLAVLLTQAPASYLEQADLEAALQPAC